MSTSIFTTDSAPRCTVKRPNEGHWSEWVAAGAVTHSSVPELGRTMKAQILRLKPPRIAMSLLGLCAICYYFIPFANYSAWHCWLCGLAPAGFGFATMIWGWAEFKKGKNPICPTERPTSLIASGPFRFGRNPMYLGIASILLAPSLWLGAPVFLIAPILFLVIVSTVFIPFEEQRLKKEFGVEFSTYASRVRRWI